MQPFPYEIAALPFSLRQPLEKAIEQDEAGHYRDALTHLLDFAEMSVMYTSHVLFMLLAHDGLAHDDAATTLRAHIHTIDTKRPCSFGVWVNELFTPLLRVAHTTLPDHPLVASLATTLLHGRKRVCLLQGTGGAPDVVKIRNQYRGHGMALSQAMSQQAIAKLDVYIQLLLQALRPLCGAVPENHGGHYVLAMDGAGNERQHLDLYPLVHYGALDAPFVFQTLLPTDKMQCVSSHENADMLVTDALNGDFDSTMQRVLPSFDIAHDLNWSEIKQLMHAETARFLAQVYKEKKYNQELFVERQGLTQLLHGFWQSDALLFPLVGEAGQGKTNQLCHWSEECVHNDQAVLIFNAADFTAQPLDLFLKETFELNPKKDIMRFLSLVDNKASEHGEHVYVFVDALNECLRYASTHDSVTKGSDDEGITASGPLMLFKAIEQLFAAQGFKQFRVLITCRTYTWKNEVLPFIDNNAPYLHTVDDQQQSTVNGFTDDETRQAYDIYRQLFQMQTDFDQLERSIAIRLKDPLILKYVCTDYQGLQLTKSMTDYTSVALFNKMMSDIANSYAGKRQAQVIDTMTDIILDSYLHGVPMDGIALNDIRRAPHDSPLGRLATIMLKDDGISIAYAELLSKAERPVLRESTKERDGEAVTYVQFVYERFLEYVLGRRFASKHGHDDAPIAASVFVDALQHDAVNVVWLGAMRHALIIDFMRHRDPATIMQLVTDWSQDYRVMSLITETIDTLVRENFEQPLFDLMQRMIDYAPGESDNHIKRLNELNSILAKGKSKKKGKHKGEEEEIDLDKVIAEHRQLTTILTPILRLRNMATVSVVNGMLLTDYFNEDLYKHDVWQLLWLLMTNNLLDTRENTCKSAYYLSNQRHTSGGTPLHTNLTWRIVQHIYGILHNHSIVGVGLKKRLRFGTESATRLCVLLIIDRQVATYKGLDAGTIPPVSTLLDAMRSLAAHFTWNFRAMRLVLPVLQPVMRHQITFQNDYVNNAIEYQGYWNDDVIAATAPAGKWCRERIKDCIAHIDFFERYGKRDANDPERQSELSTIDNLLPDIYDAYTTGDSFSYFVLERLLIVVGTNNWQWLKPMIDTLFSETYRKNEWFDYTQMSLLYSLMQVQIHSSEPNDELLAIYERESEDWTRRCRGLFKARYSHQANPQGLYKRNLLTWYAVAYTAFTGDGTPHEGHDKPVPMIYRLIDEAVENHDKELLYHIIENISEAIADSGLINTGLGLLKYIMQLLDSNDKVQQFDAIKCNDRKGIYTMPLVSAVANVLSTAKNYFPAEVDMFVRAEISGLKFPGVETYRDNILNYSPSGEKLADLLTHKFGKFLILSLLHERSVDDFSREAINQAAKSHDVFSWFAQTVRILMRHLFNAKV